MMVHYYAVEGRIIFKHTIPTFKNVTVHIYLEDISYSDGAAEETAQTILSNISHRSIPEKETIIDFQLEIKGEFKIDPVADYGVRLWIDMDNNGKVDSHDLFSSEMYRVLTKGSGRYTEIIFN